MKDNAAGGVYRVLGMVVKEDDSMKDGDAVTNKAHALLTQAE